MGSWGELSAGPFKVVHFKNMVPDELFLLFQDHMYATPVGRASARYALMGKPDHDVQFNQYKADGRLIADRLDILGFDIRTALDLLIQVIDESRNRSPWFEGRSEVDPKLAERWEAERAALAELDAEGWIKGVAAAVAAGKSATFEPPDQDAVIGSGQWLFELISDDDVDAAWWHRLRLVVHATPDVEVVLDFTDLAAEGYIDGDFDGQPTAAQQRLTAEASANSPIVVLTEGRTDAEFLSLALGLIYPHLTDLIRFLDFDQKNEGSAAALVRLVRAFAAAGIGNRVVALFDNDAAAADAISVLHINTLPATIAVQQYPPTSLLEDYPTLGPPSASFPSGTPGKANVNGLAGSIELYLGEDVLTLPDGSYRPVQWGALTKCGYQGVVIEKAEIHRLFRAKVASASSDADVATSDPWRDLRAILDQIRFAFMPDASEC